MKNKIIFTYPRYFRRDSRVRVWINSDNYYSNMIGEIYIDKKSTIKFIDRNFFTSKFSSLKECHKFLEKTYLKPKEIKPIFHFKGIKRLGTKRY